MWASQWAIYYRTRGQWYAWWVGQQTLVVTAATEGDAVAIARGRCPSLAGGELKAVPWRR